MAKKRVGPNAFHALALLSMGVAATGCGPGEATSLNVTSFSATQSNSVTGTTVQVDAVVAGDGRLPTLTVALLRGSRVIQKMNPDSYGVTSQSYSAIIPVSDILELTDTTGAGATIDVPLMVRASGGVLTAQQTLTARFGCGTGVAICAGKCAKLDSDADHCGQCGKVCSVQLSTDAYKGRCLNSVCNWPGVTVTSPSSCQSVCDGILFGGTTIKCVGRCGYTTGGFVQDGTDVFPGAVVRSKVTGNTTYVLGSCSTVPARSTTDGNFLKQLCCCGP